MSHVDSNADVPAEPAIDLRSALDQAGISSPHIVEAVRTLLGDAR